MASAVLATHNESNWGQTVVGFMAKIPYSNHLNPNPNSKKKQFHPYSSQVSSQRGDDTDSQAVMQTTSEDAAHSFNQRSKYSNVRTDLNNPAEYVRYDISSYSRTELVDLKKQLTVELEQIKGLYERIESGSFNPRLSLDEPQQFPAKIKKHVGKKRPMPFNSVKDPKRLCQRSSNGFDLNDIGDLMKKSRQILTTLMKHKHSWVFKEPVDALSLGLHDYHHIVKQPMDLGTVKAKFSKNAYSTPTDFAEDVRLTFNNAILYNPKTDKVHAWAGELLARFEDLFRPIEEKMGGLPMEDHHHAPISSSVNDDLQRNLWNHIPTPEIERMKKSTPPNLIPPTISKKPQEKPQMPKNMMKPSTSSQPFVQSSPPPKQGGGQQQRMSSPTTKQQQMASPIIVPTLKGALPKANPGKLPKPKAKDMDKREMSIEEKDRLSLGLQNLPQEKMPQLIHIIRKRNSHLAQVEDEIELDIETLDTETLWELDRFVTNWKKMVSKNKRQALMANNVNMAVGTTTKTVTGSASLSAEDNMVREIE
ncbi:transcription factor GTE7-like [Impatiens glandulifera]|uniref:transcription factor GTE7-like n=1 Tax=Impatiens glandulifera TaxID=253017 RepID=UPI001FB0DA20|nr:transcription factor GTE7-like [Impatiens glandulifera]